MMASLCVTSFRRPPKCMTAGHYLQGHLNIFLGLFLLALVSPLHSLPTQQQQDKSSEAASLADQLTILEAPPSLGKLTPYDLELAGNELFSDQSASAAAAAAEADRAKLLSKIMSLVLEGKRLPPHLVSKFPRALSLLSSSSSSGGQHKRQIRYQQCYFNPISCF